jgi:hypothetical protein
MNCKTCKHFTPLHKGWKGIKNSNFGFCNNPKIFGWDFMEDLGKIDSHHQLQGNKDEILLPTEYHVSQPILTNRYMTVGENFGCVHYKKD